MKRLALIGCAVAVVGSLMAVPAEAGRIVVANDEWTLTNFGFTTAPAINDPGIYVTNVAGWFTGGGSGTFHAYSTNFGLTESLLSAAMTGGGNTWTIGTGITFDLPTLLTYDGIFLAGNAASNTVLIDYVNAGGNVYLAGGTGCCGGAVGEAAQWNTFLHHFGLDFATSYNQIEGNLAVSGIHPILAGVDHLYQNNGNNVSDLDLSDPRNQVLVSSGSNGLYAVYDDTAAVPEPGTMLLMGMGLSALGVRRRFRKNR